MYEYQDDSEINVAGRIVALYGADGTVSETLPVDLKGIDMSSWTPKLHKK